VQLHGAPAPAGTAGRRVALNLGGIEHQELRRGDVVVTPGSHVATRMIDAEVVLLDDAPVLGQLPRVRLHLGTAEVMARVQWAGEPPQPGGGAFAQLRLEEPVVAALGDRFILRRYSPVVTIGGGSVLHPAPAGRARRSDAGRAAALGLRAEALAAGRLDEVLAGLVEEAGDRGVTETALASWLGWDAARVREALAARSAGYVAVSESPRRLVAAACMRRALDAVKAALASLHAANPLVPGQPKQALRSATDLDEEAFAALLEWGGASGELAVVRDQVSLPGHAVSLSPAEQRARDLVLGALEAAGLSPPDLDPLLAQAGLPRENALKLVKLLLQSGELIRLKEGMLVHGGVMARLVQDMASWMPPGQPFSVPDFKQRSGTSRKHAIPLLEYLDAQGITRRQGEGRVLTGRLTWRAAAGEAAR
jgi:selenocysteine-specific elongation factor